MSERAKCKTCAMPAYDGVRRHETVDDCVAALRAAFGGAAEDLGATLARLAAAESEAAKMRDFLRDVSSETTQAAVARADTSERRADKWRERCVEEAKRAEKAERTAHAAGREAGLREAAEGIPRCGCRDGVQCATCAMSDREWQMVMRPHVNRILALAAAPDPKERTKRSNFTCPKCGGHYWGSSNCTAATLEEMRGHCANAVCSFSWQRSRVDDLRLGIQSAPAAPHCRGDVSPESADAIRDIVRAGAEWLEGCSSAPDPRGEDREAIEAWKGVAR